MMETASTSETSVNFYQTTRRNNPEDSHLHTRRLKNLKSYTRDNVNYVRWRPLAVKVCQWLKLGLVCLLWNEVFITSTLIMEAETVSETLLWASFSHGWSSEKTSLYSVALKASNLVHCAVEVSDYYTEIFHSWAVDSYSFSLSVLKKASRIKKFWTIC
jgi:hypothetical protein